MDMDQIESPTCATCQFLVKCGRVTWLKLARAKELLQEVTEEERQKLLHCLPAGFASSDLNGAIDKQWRLTCAYGVWDSAITGAPHKMVEQELVKPRTEASCFFLPYKPGMGREAAFELERKQSGQRDARRAMTLSKWAIWVAVAALIVSIIMPLVNLCWDVWKYYHH
jgi:hypothetical protein